MFGIILAIFELLSSPEPEAQVSFPDQDLFVVCHRHCGKLLTLLSSSPEPLGGFQPNLAQHITAWRGFN